MIDPVGAYTGSMTVSAYNVPLDVSGTIVAGGSPVTVSITAPGQNAAITFSGTAGQQISLNLSSVTITGSNVSIINPDGSTLTSLTGVGTSGAFIDAKTLPATGTYRIFIDPDIACTGSVTLTLYNVVDVIGTVTVGGAIVSVTTTTPGQNALLTFNGSANQRVTVQLSSNTMGTVTVSLLKSDGTSLTSATSSSSSFNLTRTTLPAAGTYTIKVDPGGTVTGSIGVKVTSP